MMFERIPHKLREKLMPPPGPKVAAAIRELRKEISGLPQLSEASTDSEAERCWIQFRNTIREKLCKEDPRKFLTWEVFKNTMFVSNPAYMQEELRSLKNSSGWEDRWETVLDESSLGLPRKFPSYPQSSGNQLHLAYHLSRFEETTKVKVDELSMIVELGGGYGCMCRLIHRLGFRGLYVIFDLPELSILQKFYLKLDGLHVDDNGDSNLQGPCIITVSDKQRLDTILHSRQIDLFIATWSLSETSAEFRRAFIPTISHSKNFLIGYQIIFGEMNNKDFFVDWAASRKDVRWNDLAIEHLPGNHYLFGSKS